MFGEDDDCDLVLDDFFKKIDINNDQKLSKEKILGALCACKLHKAEDLKDNIVGEIRSGETEFIDLGEFKEIARTLCVVTGQRMQWVRILNLNGRLARQLKIGEPGDELSGIRQMDLAELETALDKFCASARRALFKQWKNLKEASDSGIGDVEIVLSKFTGTVGKFGDTGLFQEGLENQLGSPDPLVLKGLLRENVLADGAKDRKVTTNYKIVFSDYQEYVRVFGNPSEYLASWSPDQTMLSEKEWDQNRNIPVFLLEIAKGMHPSIKGPNEVELKDLANVFEALRKTWWNICKANCGMFPGEIGHVLHMVQVEVKAINSESARRLYEDIACLGKQVSETDEPLIDAGDSAPLQACFEFAVYAVDYHFTKNSLIPDMKERFEKIDPTTSIKCSHRAFIYCDIEKGDKETSLRELLCTFDHQKLIQILGQEHDLDGSFEASACIDSIVKEALKTDRARVALIQGRKRLTLRQLMEVPIIKVAKLSIIEAIQAYQYTGPLFQVFA
jgi:hypothetical protein